MRLTPRYSRILLKLSGESFKGGKSFGIENETVRYIANEIKQVYEVGVGIGVVVGGGNMWRGADYEAQGMDRSSADHAGMLATVMNALVLAGPVATRRRASQDYDRDTDADRCGTVHQVPSAPPS